MPKNNNTFLLAVVASVIIVALVLYVTHHTQPPKPLVISNVNIVTRCSANGMILGLTGNANMNVIPDEKSLIVKINGVVPTPKYDAEIYVGEKWGIAYMPNEHPKKGDKIYMAVTVKVAAVSQLVEFSTTITEECAQHSQWPSCKDGYYFCGAIGACIPKDQGCRW